MKCIKLIERAAGASHRLLELGMKCADGSVNDDDCYTDFEQLWVERQMVEKESA